MYGLGPLAGLDGGGFMSDLVLVPYADAMLIPISASIEPTAIASLSDNIPDGWRAIAPYVGELERLDESDRRVLVIGDISVGLYAAAFARALGFHVDYLSTNANRLAAAEKLGAAVHDMPKPSPSWEPYPVVTHSSADPDLLTAALNATWNYGVCTDHGVYFQPTVEIPIAAMYGRGARLVTGRANARADIPAILNVIADGCDLSPVVEHVVPWEDAPSAWSSMTGKTIFTRT
jgi:threonine dehydrogenase-like Zn-dependent dehydrogenase